MQKLIGTLLFSFFLTILQAQIYNVNLSYGGSLSDKLSGMGAELSTITDLTVSGEMDVRDFKAIRDNMKALVNLDLSAASIVSYSGSGGTDMFVTSYAANEIPVEAFSFSNVATVKLPLSSTAIGPNAFQFCSYVTQIDVPSSVLTLGEYVFYNCSILKNITIPPLVTDIPSRAFFGCEALENITIPYGVKTIGASSFANCIGISKIELPNTVESIGANAFNSCSELVQVYIPASVTSVGAKAFYFSTKLSTVSINWQTSLIVPSDVFGFVSLSSATLYVPANTKGVYEQANVWRNFGQITEMGALSVTPSTLYMANTNGATELFQITTSGSFNVAINAQWLTPSITTTTGNATIILTAQANLDASERTAVVTVSGTGLSTKTVLVSQTGATPTIVDNGIWNNSDISLVVDKNGFVVRGVGQASNMVIVDLCGRVMYQKLVSDNSYISTSNYKPGIYLVNIKSQSIKIMKE